MKRPLVWTAAIAILLGYVGLRVASSEGQQASKKSTSAAAGDRERGVGDFPKLSAEKDWPWWRGPSRNGIAPTSQGVPIRWSESENIVWRAAVPGRGHSSPIVVGNQVFMSTADERGQVQSVLAFDVHSGTSLWKTDVNRGGFPEHIHSKNTHASPTVACDGERLFVTYYNHDSLQATALSLDGKQLWQKTVGPFRPRRFEYGYGPSPQIYRDTLIVSAEFDGPSYLAALDRKTGKQVWKTARPENISFSSPVVAHVAGRDQLAISGAGQVASYDPQTGKPLWSAQGTTAATCGTVIWDGDIVIASGGYPKSETVAVRANGSGEVVWRNSQKCYEQSMLAYDGYVYGLTDNGVLFCWRVSDGQEMWKQRLRGPVSASPVLAGGHIYWANELGTMYVFKPNPQQLELVAENKLGDESFASPAVSGGRLYLRVASGKSGQREEMLYCIGRSK